MLLPPRDNESNLQDFVQNIEILHKKYRSMMTMAVLELNFIRTSKKRILQPDHRVIVVEIADPKFSLHASHLGS